MSVLFIAGLLLLNVVISWWNCRAVGPIWHEARQTGGFMRVLAWCGATQAAVGFSSLLIVVLLSGAIGLGYLPAEYAKAAASLWYLLVIIPAIGTGLVITVHSLVTAWRERNIANMGIAAWNTIATAHNLYSAASAVPNAFGDVSKLFDGDSDSDKVVLVLLIVAAAIGGGVMITAALIRKYSSQAIREARAEAYGDRLRRA